MVQIQRTVITCHLSVYGMYRSVVHLTIIYLFLVCWGGGLISPVGNKFHLYLTCIDVLCCYSCIYELYRYIIKTLYTFLSCHTELLVVYRVWLMLYPLLGLINLSLTFITVMMKQMKTLKTLSLMRRKTIVCPPLVHSRCPLKMT